MGVIMSEQSDKAPDIFQPDERLIFHFFDGEKVVRADPMILWERMKERWNDLWVDAAVAFSQLDVKGKKEAREKWFANVCWIFKVRELDGSGGLTRAEIQGLYASFQTYCEWAKKKYKSTATSPETTLPTPESTTGEPSAT
jgi:hypothetical protein